MDFQRSSKVLLGCILMLLFTIPFQDIKAQGSIAKEWNEVLLSSIRKDLARPTVHSRNLWHTSFAMYDVWTVFNSEEAEPYLLGKTVDGYTMPFDGFTIGADPEAQLEEALSFAMYRILSRRFQFSPEGFAAQLRFNNLMAEHGYDRFNTSQDYSTGSAAALGNYIGNQVLFFGNQDGANETFFYSNLYYQPINPALVMAQPGNSSIINPDRWQPLTLDVFIDQSGNEIPFNTPPFVGPEWGNVVPFSMTEDDLTLFQRDGDTYKVYHDPGPPPSIFDKNAQEDYGYIGGFSMVVQWSSHLDATDNTIIDISPASFGNQSVLPDDLADYDQLYNYMEGGDKGQGHGVNPSTGQPYAPNLVKRGDYGRCLAEFWADGPDSETPPGHWFTLINYINENPLLNKQFGGEGDVLSDLEWDIKSYFTLGAAMHDSAVSTWGIKGYYDYVRPVSAIRYMCDKGQSSDPAQPSYNLEGIKLIPGSIELVLAGDPLAGANGEHINKIKVKSWKGPDYINNPVTDVAGVDWILGENWWPYQRPSFVTPPFAGYLSGHSTFSRAAAETLTYLTGDEYFPGGMGVFDIQQDDFLVFEKGPSEGFQLQWATYRDASDQTSLSRIWGGIHPPCDDIPGRKIGIKIANDVFDKAKTLFYKDTDGDGFYTYEDCDDADSTVYPGAPELCDAKDNDCNGLEDDNIPFYTYYQDLDSDGFGNGTATVSTCETMPPLGYVIDATDCNDSDLNINSSIAEICDGIDNDCNGEIDDNITYYTYYQDADSDGFGNEAITIFVCDIVAPAGYVVDFSDCDDDASGVNTSVVEICDGIDNDCNGEVDDNIPYRNYYLDSDQDGYGDVNVSILVCDTVAPDGYSDNSDDCDDSNSSIYPSAPEIADNGIDEDCSGVDLYLEPKVFPNPISDIMTIHYVYTGDAQIALFSTDQKYSREYQCSFVNNETTLDVSDLAQGLYRILIYNSNDEIVYQSTIVKIDG